MSNTTDYLDRDYCWVSSYSVAVLLFTSKIRLFSIEEKLFDHNEKQNGS